jgi:hypothetical protein
MSKVKQDLAAIRRRCEAANTTLKPPRGKTFLCAGFCGLRVPSKRHSGCYEASTGKPICMDCEESL